MVINVSNYNIGFIRTKSFRKWSFNYFLLEFNKDFGQYDNHNICFQNFYNSK